MGALCIAPQREAVAQDPAHGPAVLAPSFPIRHAGRWMLDTGGRVLVIHGVNMPSKLLPGYPAALGFDDDDAAFLASEGFNAVRLTVERYAVARDDVGSQPGRFDSAYVAQIAHTVDTLAAHGIASLIDFHQDEYGPVFFDNGFPAWMTVTDGLPNLFEVGFPAQYTANPALNRAFDHFWANDPDTTASHRLQADDGAILGHVAAGLRGKPTVLGYEILNEPWPGSQYPACFVAATGCPTFDRGPVSAYYAAMTAAIRAADPTHLIWFEPLVSFNYGVPTSVLAPPGPDLGFAFHDYPACSAADDAKAPVSGGGACGAEQAMTIDHAQAYSAQTGTALLETEFGATKNTATIATAVDTYDAAMVPWMFWSYTNYMVKLGPDGSLLAPSGANIDAGILDALVRPYPQLVSGTPLAYGFDPSTHAFTFRYATRRADGGGSFADGSETDIAVPRRKFPAGYGVQVRGARQVSGPGASILRVTSCRGAREVAVSVSAAPSSATCAAGGAGASSPAGAATLTGRRSAASLCRAGRRLRFRIQRVRHRRVVRAVVVVNGKRLLVRHAHNLRRISFARPSRSRVVVKITTTDNRGRRVVSVRTFSACTQPKVPVRLRRGRHRSRPSRP